MYDEELQVEGSAKFVLKMHFPWAKTRVLIVYVAFLMWTDEKAANFAVSEYLIDQLSFHTDNVFVNFPSVTDEFVLTI